jgi:hypothetical protein
MPTQILRSNLGEEGGGLGVRYNGRARPSYNKSRSLTSVTCSCEGRGEVEFTICSTISH